MHNATAITTGSANQRPNTPCIRLWIDVTFRGLEDSYMLKVGMYENSQKQGSCRREKSGESCLKKNRHMNA